MVVPGGVDRGGEWRVIPVLLGLISRITREHELHVFALRQEARPARWTLRGATVHNAGTARPGLRAFRDLLAEHRRAPFAVLHGIWCRPGLVAASAARLLGRPALVQLVGGDLGNRPEIGYGMLRRRRGQARLRAAAALASHLTVESGFAREIAERAGVRPELLPFGVALDEWPPLPPRRRKPGAEARLLFVGSLNPVKDPWTLLRGMAALRDRGVRFRLDAVGEDVMDGAAQRFAAELGLSGHVTFHGFRTSAGLRPLMERADLLVVSSRHEGAPAVALEAAVCGVPAVGTPVGHLAGWAPDAAATYPVADHQALAGTVAAVLADEERRLRMAHAAQRRAIDDDADRAAARVLEIYRTLTRSPA